MVMLITPWHGAHDIRGNRSQLIPIEYKSGPSYVKHALDISIAKPSELSFLSQHAQSYFSENWDTFIGMRCRGKIFRFPSYMFDVYTVQMLKIFDFFYQ